MFYQLKTEKRFPGSKWKGLETYINLRKTFLILKIGNFGFLSFLFLQSRVNVAATLAEMAGRVLIIIIRTHVPV